MIVKQLVGITTYKLRELFQKEVSEHPYQDPKRVALADFLYAEKLYADAETALAPLVERFTPLAVDANRSRAAWIQLRLGKHDRAVELFEEAERLQFASARGISSNLDYGIGLAYAASRRPEAAARLRRALARDPQHKVAEEARAVLESGN